VSYFFVTTQDGRVHSVNAATGALVWSTQLTQSDGTTPAGATAAPAGIFSDFGAPWSYLLVGTREAGGNLFYALDPYTGGVIDWFPKPVDGTFDIGAINSMASVDYGTRTVFFASRGTALTPETLWCLTLGPPTDALQLGWNRDVDNVDGSPTLRWGGDRVYVGNNQGVVWAVDKTDGVLGYSYATNDGMVQAFVFPDRRNSRIYFSTVGSGPLDGSVWGLNDTGTALQTVWDSPYRVWGIKDVSPVLFLADTGSLYVGTSEAAASGGGLYRIRVDLANPNSILDARILESTPVTIGAPSLDGPNNLIHVGSEGGVLYAVTPVP
jgi:outer membrane protein assembly factor BamB